MVRLHQTKRRTWLNLYLSLELAVLIDDPHAYSHPTASQLRKWHSEQQEDIKQQAASIEAKGEKEGAKEGRAMSPEALKKRKEREGRKAAKLAQTAAANPDDPNALLIPESDSNSVPTLSDTLALQSATDAPDPKSASFFHAIVIPTPSSSLEWYDSSTCSYSTIAAAKAAGIWDYPSTLQERARCGVFRSLWEQDYFMGGGIKFGGDYLVYPGTSRILSSVSFLTFDEGDPLRYHSHFAATVLDSPLSALRPMEIVAHGRLGTATKKTHLLCSWDDDKKDVSYLTIEWAGFG